jgi:hypothetical protein
VIADQYQREYLGEQRIHPSVWYHHRCYRRTDPRRRLE